MFEGPGTGQPCSHSLAGLSRVNYVQVSELVFSNAGSSCPWAPPQLLKEAPLPCEQNTTPPQKVTMQVHMGIPQACPIAPTICALR